MSKQKSRTPCFVAGCVVVAVIFIVVIIMLSVLFLHIPTATDFYGRMEKQDKLRSVYVDEGLDLTSLSAQSRNIYQVLQSDYSLSHPKEQGEEDEDADPADASFVCRGIVEYYSNDKEADDKGYVYGMLIYTDSITTAYDVFTTYYRIANDQGVDFSNTDYFLFVRGAAVFVGNNRAFLKAYMNNLF